MRVEGKREKKWKKERVEGRSWEELSITPLPGSKKPQRVWREPAALVTPAATAAGRWTRTRRRRRRSREEAKSFITASLRTILSAPGGDEKLLAATLTIEHAELLAWAPRFIIYIPPRVTLCRCEMQGFWIISFLQALGKLMNSIEFNTCWKVDTFWFLQ